VRDPCARAGSRRGGAAPPAREHYLPRVGLSDATPSIPRIAPARRWAVVLNASAGGAGDAEVAGRVRDALAAAGVEATVWTTRGADAATLARRAADDPAFDAIVAAGGDGTVSAVAGVLAGTGRPLAVLPLGTLNHFAKDLGVPADLDAAARALAAAAPRSVDVGEVNGRVFVNNSSIGVYPRVVRERERLRKRLGRSVGKWLAMAWALVLVLLRLRPLSVRIRWGRGGEPTEGGVARRTTFVFVGNNRYDTVLLANQRRAALDRGVLGVYVGREQTRLAMLRLGVRSLLRRVDARDLEALEVCSLALHSRRRSLAVAVDGEVARLTPPIRYRVRPGALQVLAPAPA
jgi:diacylglycerol kinase family enzyme